MAHIDQFIDTDFQRDTHVGGVALHFLCATNTVRHTSQRHDTKENKMHVQDYQHISPVWVDLDKEYKDGLELKLSGFGFNVYNTGPTST